MKFWLFCLLLAALPGFGEDRRQEPVPITLYTKFDHTISADVRAAVQEEVGAIMDPIGITFDWRNLSSANGAEVSFELAVITFKGTCSTVTPVPRVFKVGALGWTHVSDGIILPFADVDCDRIHSFLQQDLQWRNPGSRDRLFGRAIGRVLAHELYHIFANTSRHGSCGVGKAAYTVNELLSNDFRFEESESRMLRAKRVTNEGAPAAAGTYE